MGDTRIPTIKLSVLFLALWIACTCIYGARDVETRQNPNLYAEDANWLDVLKYEKGWGKYVSERDDYFVIGNLALLEASRILHKVVFANDIFLIPLSIAATSWIFYGLLAALPLILFHRRFSIWALLLYGILFALMPMGADEPVVLGRLSNVGYSFSYLTLLLILYLSEEKPTVLGKYAAQAGILLGLLTNPTGFAFLPLLVRQYSVRGIRTVFHLYFPLVLCTAFLVGTLFCRYWALQSFNHPNHFDSPVKWGNAIEFTLGRGFFYLFFSSVYRYFSDVWVVALFCGFAIKFILAKNYTHLRLILATLIALLIQNGLFLLGRPGLTGLLGHYDNAGPSCYYISQNSIAFLLLFMVIYSLQKQSWGKVIGVLVLAVYVCGVTNNIASKHQHYFRDFGNWTENIIQTALNQNETNDYYLKAIHVKKNVNFFQFFVKPLYSPIPAYEAECVVLYFALRTKFEAIEKQLNDTMQKIPGTIELRPGTESPLLVKFPPGYNVFSYNYMCEGANQRRLHGILSWNSKKYRKPHRIIHDFSALFHKGDIYLSKKERASIKEGTLSLTIAPDSVCKHAVLSNWGMEQVK